MRSSERWNVKKTGRKICHVVKYMQKMRVKGRIALKLLFGFCSVLLKFDAPSG
jgi:hypothetical protein